MEKSTNDIEREIVKEFSSFQEWDARYDQIIKAGKVLPPFDENYKKEENKIKGCQSDLWMLANYIDGKVYFRADSDSLIVKGMVALLIRVLSGQTPDSILKAELGFIDSIGMRQHLAPNRSNGLRYMINRMKSYAMAFRTAKRL